MRRLLAWAVFLLGDAVSRVMYLSDWLSFLYPPYNRLMGWSDTIQGPSDRGPWSAVLASAIEASGQDGETRLDRNDESAGPQDDAHD